MASKPGHRKYVVKTVNSLQIPYTADEIDSLAAYIFAEDAWYILPVAIVENHPNITLNPLSRRTRYEQYREAWKLMESRVDETAPKPVLETAVDVVLAT